jgi:hypothetical protein
MQRSPITLVDQAELMDLIQKVRGSLETISAAVETESLALITTMVRRAEFDLDMAE